MPETQRRPTLKSYTSGNSYFYFAVFLGAVILVAAATMGGYKARLVERIDELDVELERQEAGRNKDREKELVAAAKQSKVMKQLIESKLYWSQALGRIEQMMQSSVALTSIKGDVQKGVIGYQATAGTYAAVARQLAAFVAATGIKDISVGEISTATDGTVEFTGELLIDAKSLLMKAQPSRSPTPTP